MQRQGNDMTPSNPIKVQQLINGEFQHSAASHWIDVTDPATQSVIAQVPCTTADEMQEPFGFEDVDLTEIQGED